MAINMAIPNMAINMEISTETSTGVNMETNTGAIMVIGQTPITVACPGRRIRMSRRRCGSTGDQDMRATTGRHQWRPQLFGVWRVTRDGICT